MHILISPNAFKGSLDAFSAARAIEAGLLKSPLNCTTQCFPIADGGDGTAEIITRVLNGRFVKTSVQDALGRKTEALFGIVDNGKTAVIDIAAASGIRLLSSSELDPKKTSTFGSGELISSAIDAGISKILLGVGGSATVDAGSGLMGTLGAKFHDGNGKTVNPVPENFHLIKEIDISAMMKRLKGIEIIILCDVNNPLLGTNGAAPVFAPQKGANPDDVKFLESALIHFNALIKETTGKDTGLTRHGGAAGGIAAGLYGLADAKLVSGIDYFLKLTDFDKAIEKADLLITGEGSIDEQTLEGKAPFGVALIAKKRRIPVIGLAGRVPLEKSSRLTDCFDFLFPIQNQSSDLITAMKNTYINLECKAEEVGNLLHQGRLSRC
jgi:glycerate 2-kinase